MRHILLILFCLLIMPAQATELSDAQATVTKLVQHLHTINGNFALGGAPKVKILEEKSMGAAYNPVTHVLSVDLEVYQLCQSFNAQAMDALAFIVGHEMAHCYMEHNFFSKFNHYHKCKGSEISPEKGADIYGLFNAYLAGYQSFQLVPQVIEKLYQAYGLSDQLSGYPSKQERMNITHEVQAQVEELIQVYEAANYLSAIGKYDLAAASYEYILQFYQGREVYNNLGVSYALDALYFTDKDYDLYLFPLEIDWESRIKKPKIDRSDRELTPDEYSYRKAQLQKAKSYLEHAGKLDQSYFTVDINMLCVLTLMEDFQGAIQYHQHLEQSKKMQFYEISSVQEESMNLALAIAKAGLAPSKEEANGIFASLENSRHAHIAYAASFNKKVLEDGTCAPPKPYTCVQPMEIPNMVDQVRLYRYRPTNTARDLTQRIRLSIDKLDSSMLCQYTRDGRVVFTLQQVKARQQAAHSLLNSAEKVKFVHTTNGYFLLCENERTVFQLDGQNKILGWGRYY